MNGINLHNVVRGAVTAVHPDETLTLYRSTGRTNVNGRVTPSYASPVTIKAQVQGVGGDDLLYLDATARSKIMRKFYLYSDDDISTRPAGIIRPVARGGDMMLRSDGTWWLITSVSEDFSSVGWESVIGTMQEKGVTGA